MLTLWILNLRFCEAKGLVSNKVIRSIVETTTVLCLLLFLVTRKQRNNLFNLPSCSLLLFKSLLKASANYKFNIMTRLLCQKTTNALLKTVGLYDQRPIHC